VDKGLTIAEAARRTGLTANTLRNYERAGLLAGSENGDGKRRYTEQDLDQIRLLTRLRATGMSASDVRRYAELARSGSAAGEVREVLVAHRQRVLARIAQLHEDLALVEYKIQQFQQVNGYPAR
jgi:DNA-binding transcriptional MerR regulator